MRLSFSVLSGHSGSIGICRQQARWRVNDFSKTDGVGSASNSCLPILSWSFRKRGVGEVEKGEKGNGGVRPFYILF